MSKRAREKCRAKVAHRTRGDAIVALKRVGNAGLDAYRCPHCRLWHLGRSRMVGKRLRRMDQIFEAIARERETQTRDEDTTRVCASLSE